MKMVHRNIIMFLVCCGAILTASQAFCAATGFEDDSGGPQGLAIQGDARGEKLAGVVVLELYNFSEDTEGNAIADCNVVARLRKAQNIQTLYTELDLVPLQDPAVVQMLILNAFKDQILEKFFDDDQTVGLVLRTAEEFGSVFDFSGDVEYTLANIVIAGK